jgi:hypothetical protein
LELGDCAELMNRQDGQGETTPLFDRPQISLADAEITIRDL